MESKKSHQTALGMASIFSIHFCSNILQHLGHFHFGFRVKVGLRRPPARKAVFRRVQPGLPCWLFAFLFFFRVISRYFALKGGFDKLRF
jgi:hypothetical protein